MKHGTITSILLFFLGLMVQAAGAADIQVNGEFLSSPRARLTGTVLGVADVEMNGDVNVTGGLAAAFFIGSGAGLTGLPGSDLYSNVVTVDASGGDYTNPATAMANYSTWCPSPSAASPCLLKILPGVYDVGTGGVVMRPYIDIEGSGEDSTIITGSRDTGGMSCGPPPPNGVVNGADNAEIRRLTIRHTGGGNAAAGMVNINASPKVTNVTVTVSPATYCTIGMRSNNSSPVITGVKVTATGSGSISTFGIYNDTGASPSIRNSMVTASGLNQSTGIFNGGSPGRVKIYDSVIKATTQTIWTHDGVITMIFNTQLDGGGVLNTGTGATHCVGVFDENFALSQYDTCPQ